MPANERYKMRIDEGDRNGQGCMLPTLLVVAAILLITGWVAARTDGARSLAEQWLKDQLGLEIKVQRMRIGWPYTVVLEGVQTRGFDEQADQAGIHIEQARIGLAGWRRVRVVLQKPTVRFREGEKGWEPACWSAAGRVPAQDLAAVSGALLSLSGRYTLMVRQGAVAWQDTGGKIRAWVKGLFLQVEPAQVPGRRMVYCRLGVQRAWSADGGTIDGVEREWLAAPDVAYVELGRTGGRMTGPAARFWEPQARTAIPAAVPAVPAAAPVAAPTATEARAEVMERLQDVVAGPRRVLEDAVRERVTDAVRAVVPPPAPEPAAAKQP